MAVTERREILIEATPDEILGVLLDVEKLPEWSSAHQEVEVLARDDVGRPARTRQVVKIAGITDEQVLEHTTFDDGIGWTLVSSTQQRAQRARYTLIPAGDATRVRLDLTVELIAPLPGFLVRQGAKGLLGTATRGCAPGAGGGGNMTLLLAMS